MTESVFQSPTIVDLGEGTFTREAVLTLRSEAGGRYDRSTPIGVDLLMPEYPDIAHIFEAVSRGMATYGITPMENSTVGAGHVQESVDALVLPENDNLQIVRELVMKVRQSLYMQPDAFITTIASKDKAIQQCQGKLRKMFPQGYTSRCTTSTAAALLLANQHPYIAAIAGPGAAEKLGITNLQQIDGMEDNSFNATRFIVLGQKNGVIPIAPNYKTTFALTIEDQPGSLFGCLEKLANAEINLNEIKSSSLGRNNEARLLVSIDGHQEEDRVRIALEELKEKVRRVRLLGSYPKADYTPYQTSEMPDIDYLAEEIQEKIIMNGSRDNHSIIVFTLPDEAGALCRVLEPLQQINLTDVDSIATNSLGRYAFYLSFHNHVSGRERLIAQVEERCEQMRAKVTSLCHSD